MNNFYGRYPFVEASAGVASLDGMSGALTLIAGSGITVTDGAGSITIAATGGAFANQDLSNLTNPTAINQDLVFNKATPSILANGTTSLTIATAHDSIGSTTGALTLSSGSGHDNTGPASFKSGDTINGVTGDVTIGSGDAASIGTSGNVNIFSGSATSTGNTGWASLSTSNTAPGTGDAGDVFLIAGNGNSGAGGSINITPGGSTSGAPGKIKLLDNGLGLIDQHYSAASVPTFGPVSGTFMGIDSNQDQTAQVVVLGSTDTAVTDNHTSNVFLCSGSITAASSTANAGSIYIVSGGMAGGIGDTGNAGGINLITGDAVLGLGGDIILTAGAGTPKGNIRMNTVGGDVSLQTGGGTIRLGTTSGSDIIDIETTLATPAAGALTLANAPAGVSGNPSGYVHISINGVPRVIPFWG